MARVALLLAAGAVVVAAACHSERLRLQNAAAPTLTPPEPAPPAAPLRVATFNAGLAVGVIPRAAERADEVVSALAGEKLDLLCVQEVWLDQHWQSLRAAVRPRLPHALRPPSRSASDDKPCGAAELAPVARCALTHCWSEGASGAAECAMRHCARLARDLAPECVGCLSRHPLQRVGEILDECVDPNPVRARSPGGTGKAVHFFDGSYGIGLLSALPLLDRDQRELVSAHHPRAVLHARVEVSGAPLHVFCTHLTPSLAGIPHPSGGSWTEEQSAQVDALLDYVKDRAGTQPAIVLGDLNTGPAAAGVRERNPEHYARLIRAGFVNPYLDAEPASCTFCYDNPLTRGRGRGLVIDHVLLRGLSGTAHRFLDAPALSDHYGVVALVDVGSWDSPQ